MLKIQIHVERSHDLQIVIEATAGISWAGDIAIDDVKFFFGYCPPSPECDFENGDHYCGFRQDTTDNFDWKVGTGATVTDGTGPSYDHTYQSDIGHYVYMDASDVAIEKYKARLFSPIFPATEGSCLSFYYHITGDHVGELNVYRAEGSNLFLMFNVHEDMNDHWRPMEVTVTSPVPYEVQISGSRI